MKKPIWTVTSDKGFLSHIAPPIAPRIAPPIAPTEALERWPALRDMALTLPERIEAGRARAELAALPMLERDAIDDPATLENLHRLYGYFASAYVHGPPDAPASTLPAALAQPLVNIAERVGRPPMLAYAGMVLHNWRLRDPAGAFTLDNLELQQTFTRLADERWFFLVHIAIEARAGTLLQALRALPAALAAADDAAVLDHLRTLHHTLVELVKLFHRMPEQCDPDRYYQQVRPFLFGFDGVIYEGAYGHQPQGFRGGSGAQSSVMPALLAGLGVQHERSELVVHLEGMRAYMPVPHQRFIQALRTLGLRDYVRQRPPLVDAYNHVLRQLMTFRRAHLYYAKTYIFERSTNPVGTGGTSFMTFLSRLIDETRAQMLL